MKSEKIYEKRDVVVYKGVFAGKLASEQEKRVLILGESHHGDPTVWEQENKTTKDVVLSYLKKYNDGQTDPSYSFFEKIVDSFGFDSKKDREEFWSKVYFGNYVSNVLCGIGDNKAKEAIAANRDEYNKELFQFINNNHIDIIFCFSRRVWNSLPEYIYGDGETYREDTGRIGSQKDYIKSCIYVPGPRKADIPALDKELKVYGMRHPSARGGFKPENYQAILHDALCVH